MLNFSKDLVPDPLTGSIRHGKRFVPSFNGLAPYV